MEGDPLEEGGLEYLFGVVFRDEGELRFRPFWAHSRAEERQAFEAFMDFVAERLARFPDLHIYHYAAYEVTALKRLMSLHGTREAQVDDLLRRGKFVDLYKVVRETIRVSEPSYSLKSIETFYREKREGEVTSAGASIVFYERWKEERDDAILDEIRRYNEDDCRSTEALCTWLRGLAPAGGGPRGGGRRAGGREAIGSESRGRSAARAVPRAAHGRPAGEARGLDPDDELRELAFQLLDFHRRQAKPAWWAMFERQDKSEEELIEDPECIGGMTRDPAIEPFRDKQSLVYTYRFEPQDFKLRSGEECVRADTRESLGEVDDRRGGPPGSGQARHEARGAAGAAVDRAGKADRQQAVGGGALPLRRFGERRVRAVSRARGVPAEGSLRIGRRAAGTPVVADASDLDQVVEAVAGLKESNLFIQGPPGAGKTYTGAHVIVELLKRGKRVGVSSNSHKAINNLLAKVEEVAKEAGRRASAA